MVDCKLGTKECTKNCGDICYYQPSYDAGHCAHCIGMGCDYCEDITLPLHNKKAMGEAIDFCKGSKK